MSTRELHKRYDDDRILPVYAEPLETTEIPDPTATTELAQPSWVIDLVETYSRELQIERNGEGEGWITQAESFLFDRVFENPKEASDLYEVLLSPDTDPEIRLKAVECGLERLWKTDRVRARGISFKLLLDSDETVKTAAQPIIETYW